jgi:hypothetical protein
LFYLHSTNEIKEKVEIALTNSTSSSTSNEMLADVVGNDTNLLQHSSLKVVPEVVVQTSYINP